MCVNIYNSLFTVVVNVHLLWVVTVGHFQSSNLCPSILRNFLKLFHLLFFPLHFLCSFWNP